LIIGFPRRSQLCGYTAIFCRLNLQVWPVVAFFFPHFAAQQINIFLVRNPRLGKQQGILVCHAVADRIKHVGKEK